MTWTKEITIKLFEELLNSSKKFYKDRARLIGTSYYTKEDEVTSEELEMACMIIKNLGNVK